jgi:hypothetical protein
LQRIKEIEENLKREFVETVRDSNETATLISKVLSSSTEEIQLIFSGIDSLRQYKKHGMLGIIKEKSKNGILVRMIIGTDSPIVAKDLEVLIGCPQIEMRYLNKSIQTRIITIIMDRELWEISIPLTDRNKEIEYQQTAISHKSFRNVKDTRMDIATFVKQSTRNY